MKNCLLKLRVEDLTTVSGREVISKKVKYVRYDLNTGKVDHDEIDGSKIAINYTTLTIKVKKAEDDYINVDVDVCRATMLQDGRIVGTGDFTCIQIGTEDDQFKAEIFCGEYDECSRIDYWMTDETVPNLGALACKMN